jgi:large subunit ribosomal protein L24
MRVKKNDTIMVISGDDKGSKGKVLKVFPGEKRIIVEGINFIKRHTRVRKQGQQGGIVEKEAPINVSNVKVVCPKCGKPTTIKINILHDGSRVRTCKLCNEMITS